MEEKVFQTCVASALTVMDCAMGSLPASPTGSLAAFKTGHCAITPRYKSTTIFLELYIRGFSKRKGPLWALCMLLLTQSFHKRRPEVRTPTFRIPEDLGLMPAEILTISNNCLSAPYAEHTRPTYYRSGDRRAPSRGDLERNAER